MAHLPITGQLSKKVYAAPKLVTYGSLRELTQAGLISKNENNGVGGSSRKL